MNSQRGWLSFAVVGAMGFGLSVLAAYGPFLLSLCCETFPTPLGIGQLQSLLISLAWAGVMLVLWRRHPDGPMWKLVLALLVARTITLGYSIPTDIAWSLSALLFFLPDAMTPHLTLAFPSGRLANTFDRRLIVFVYSYTLVSRAAQMMLLAPVFTGAYQPRNVFLVWSNTDLAQAIGNITAYSVPLLAAIVLWRLWQRWRTATPSLRRVLSPLVIAMPLQGAITVAWYLVPALGYPGVTEVLGGPLFVLPYLILPAGFLLGALRSRFARAIVADLAVELGRGVPLGSLEDLLRRRLHDPSLRLLFPASDGPGFVDSAGRPADRSLVEAKEGGVTRREHDRKLTAVLVHDPGLELENPGLVEAVGSVATLALENEWLTAQVRAQLDEVRASRARLVEATDSERHRIERDLHDGAQQRLLALAVRLQTARTTGEEAGQLLDLATDELQAAVAEVRDIARGLHPMILSELGLGPALEALAERAAIPVRVHATERRYPSGIESAAYFVAAEAMTNVVRHAAATAADITVTSDRDNLVIAVADDGAGGADANGSGLRGLMDRVAAVGGTLTVNSPPGHGTQLTATMPLR